MKIVNAKVFLNGKFQNLEVQYKDGVITNIGEKIEDSQVINANGQYLYAGMIETHMHGGFSYAFYDNGYVDFSNGEEQVREICRQLPYHGVTSVIATLDGGISLEALRNSTKAIRKARKNIVGADPFKIHYEGPYMNAEQTAAINPTFQVTPSKEHTLKMADGDLSDVAIICVAPELPGAMEWIKWVTGQGVKVEACYTRCTSDQIREAADNGMDQTSHLYNGFEKMHHRKNSSVSGCLLDDRINVQLICDNFHVSSDWIKLAVRLKGIAHCYGITDMTSFSGMPDGEHNMPYFGTIVVKNGEIRDKEGMILGGNNTWDKIMRTARDKIGLSMEEVGSLYSENPAKCLGITDRGKIEAGRRADFVIMDKDYHVLETIIKGETYFKTRS